MAKHPGKPIRRVVTGHDANGKAVILKDGAAENVRVRGSAGFVSTLLWATDETPANVSGTTDEADRDIGVPPPPNGSVFRMVEFPPEREDVDAKALIEEMGLPPEQADKRHPFMHRTKSIDYAVVLSGRITMMMDEEEDDVELEAGDVVIQRGTNHAWVNYGPENCLVAFVLIDAEKPKEIKE